MNIHIHRATLADAQLIAPLFDLYRQFYQQPSDLILCENFISDRLAQEQSVLFYALDENNNALGFTQLFPSYSSVSAQSIWILNDLYVIEDARGLGVASLLLDTAGELARSTNAKGIQLETTPDNKAAQSLYKKYSYQLEQGYLHYFLTV